MMNLRVFLATAALFFAVQASIPAAIAQESTLDIVKKRGELIAGVRYDMPPYGYVGDGGSVTGIDIEIVNAVAKKLGVKVQLKQVPPTSPSRISRMSRKSSSRATAISSRIATWGARPSRASRARRILRVSVPRSRRPRH
jgi:ABC-type amino acid transport substrate-binding protein